MKPVLDLVRFRLQRELNACDEPYLAEAGLELLHLYDMGILRVEFEAGELVISLSGPALEALQPGGLYDLLKPPSEEGTEDVGPLNAGPSR